MLRTLIALLHALVFGFGLRGRLSRRIGGAALLMLVLTAWLGYGAGAAVLQRQAEATARAQAHAAAAEIDGYIQTSARIPAQLAVLLASDPTFSLGQLHAYSRALLRATPPDRAYDVFTFFDDKSYRDPGAEVIYNRASLPHAAPPTTYDYHDPSQDWYVGPKRTHHLYVSQPYFDDGGANVDMVSLTMPILRGRRFLGVTGTDLTLGRLSHIVGHLSFASATTRLTRGSFAFLVTAQGNLVTYPDPTVLVGKGRAGQTLTRLDHGAFASLARMQQGGDTPIPVQLRGHVTGLVFTAPVPSAGWTLALVVPEDAIFAPLGQWQRLAILLTLGSLVAMLVLVLVQSNRIVRPLAEVQAAAASVANGDITHLAQAMTALAHGDLTMTVAATAPAPTYHSADETGQTAEAMRTIVARVGQTIGAYEQARAGLQRLYRDLEAKNAALTDANTRLETLATTDPLTGLPNRTLLHDRLEHSLVLAQRDGTASALLLMDLDRFKEVNDTLGHHYGDLLLQQIGARMKAVLRASDTVARLGGDEFAVLLPQTDATGAITAAQTILAAFEASFRVEGQNLDIGASIGIAAYPEHGDDAATVLRHADVAMYLAKRAHSGYAVYETSRDHHSSHRLALMSELRHALAEGQLLLYYQPLVNLATDALTGVEVLLRWPHPQHGFIPPDQFIPLAEHTGLIGPLTQWVLDEALRQCGAWQRSGLLLSIQVNLSMRSLHDIALPKTVATLLDRHGVPAEYLTLEITESALMIDPARALDVLTRLSEIGVRVAIDDFGTGYSSLGYLKRLPVHEVKIDKSFVLGMEADSRDAAIVRSVVAMAHAMGLDVVAEGVENTQAMGLLRSLTCDVAQGFHLSRPLPAEDLERWMTASPYAQDRLSA